MSDKPLPPRPTQAEQFTMRRKFFDRYLKGERNEVDSWPGMRFFNLGEEAFHDTDDQSALALKPGRRDRERSQDGDLG